MTYIPPEVFASKFTCPHCGAIAHMVWESRTHTFASTASPEYNQIRIAHCKHCDNYSLWHKDTMVYPDRGVAPPPNPDMPESVLRLYNEAASISGKSPRGAAALLRLGIQRLCTELGESGKNINADIASLVKKGLPDRVQKSLDIVRVTGNNAVHPGQIDTDDEGVVGKLFGLINVIIEYTVSLPSRIEGFYEGLPDGAREQIEERDSSEPDE